MSRRSSRTPEYKLKPELAALGSVEEAKANMLLLHSGLAATSLAKQNDRLSDKCDYLAGALSSAMEAIMALRERCEMLEEENDRLRTHLQEGVELVTRMADGERLVVATDSIVGAPLVKMALAEGQVPEPVNVLRAAADIENLDRARMAADVAEGWGEPCGCSASTRCDEHAGWKLEEVYAALAPEFEVSSPLVLRPWSEVAALTVVEQVPEPIDDELEDWERDLVTVVDP